MVTLSHATAFLAVFPCVAFLLSVSCSRPDTGGAGREFEPIMFSAGTDRTKGVVAGETLPESYTIYVSSFYTNTDDPLGGGDYFRAKPFRFHSGMWSAEPAVYWPLGGNLDFISIACEDSAMDIASQVSWNEKNCTEGLEVSLRDGDCLNSEILFAATRGCNAGGGVVPLKFKHSQSCLQFEIICETRTLRIDGIVLENAYSGGVLRVSNGAYLDARWSFRGYRRTDITVPGTVALIPEAGIPSVCNVFVPEQDACDVVIHFSVRSSASDDWSTARRHTFRHRAGADPWFYGEKNVFRMSFLFTGIELSCSVNQWNEYPEEYYSLNK